MEIIALQLHKKGVSMCASLCEAVGHITQPGGLHLYKKEKKEASKIIPEIFFGVRAWYEWVISIFIKTLLGDSYSACPYLQNPHFKF